jgi:hypothetical protein
LQIPGSVMRILTLTALLALAGCASQDVAGPSSSAAAPAAADAPVAQVASTSAPEATAAAQPNSVFRPPPGYKRRPDMGENIYCTKIKVLGSRFPKDDCRSEAELRDLEQQRESARGEMDQRNKICAGGGACQAQ